MDVGESTTEGLTLFAALQAWCSQALVDEVRKAERRHIRGTLECFPRPKLTTSDEWRRPEVYDLYSAQFDPPGLVAAWEALENDLRSKLENAELLLTAVQSGGVDPVSQPVHGAFAGEFAFDFHRSTITQGEKLYLRVRVTKPALSTGKAVPAVFSVDTVRSLAPEVVAGLLEMHAAHVCADLGIKLTRSGWASVMALVASKMRQRAESGELRPALAEEARWLSEWAAGAAPSYDTPKEKTISNRLGRLHGDLLASRASPPSGGGQL